MYDYIWDRWGVYVGTIRAGLPCLVVADSLLFEYAVKNGGTFTQSWCLHAALWGLFLWFFPVRQHLQQDWEDQDKGRFAKINKRANEQRDGFHFFFRIFVLGLMLPYTFAAIANPTLESLNYLVAQPFMIAWFYVLTTCTRERDSGRFKEHRFASEMQ